MGLVSDNPFPSVLCEIITTPSGLPPADHYRIFFKTDGYLYKVDESGVETIVNTGDYATLANILNQSSFYAAGGGTANVITLTLSPVPGSYTTGMRVCFKANASNTGPATINVNSLGAKAIKRDATENLQANDIIANQIVTLVYDGTNFQISHPQTNRPPSLAGAPDYVLIQDQKSANTDGGGYTSGSRVTRDLNTEVNDASGLASLSSNQISLSAGDYLVRALVPAYRVGSHQAYLYNVTGTADLLNGTSAFSDASAGDVSYSIIHGHISLSATTVLEIQQQCETTKSTDGLGLAANLDTELYTSVEFIKLGSKPNFGHTTVTYASSLSMDLNGNVYQSISLTGDISFTTTNRAAGRAIRVRVVGDGSSRTLTFHTDWRFVGTKPTTIAASKTGILTLSCFGTQENDVIAEWAVN
jgi:hypothetical protein